MSKENGQTVHITIHLTPSLPAPTTKFHANLKRFQVNNKMQGIEAYKLKVSCHNEKWTTV